MKFIYQYILALWYMLVKKQKMPTRPGLKIFDAHFNHFTKQFIKEKFVAGWRLKPWLDWKQSSNHNHYDRGWDSIKFLSDRVRIVALKLKVPKKPPHWITDNPFVNYHYSSGRLVSIQSYRAPFHIMAQCTMPNIEGITPAVWLINDLQECTREFDLFETNEKSFYTSIHWGGHNYENREMNNVVVPIKSAEGWHYPEAYVYPDRVVTYLDNVKIAEMEMDNAGIDYHVIIGFGVWGWPKVPATFDIKSLHISEL